MGLSRYAASDDSRTVRLPLPARGEREWGSVGARHPTIPEPCASLSPHAGRGSGTQSVRGIRRFPDRCASLSPQAGRGSGLSRCAASDDSRTVRLPLPARGAREWGSVGARHPTIPGPCASISPLAGSGSGTRSVRGIRRFPDRAPPSPRLREARAGLGRRVASDDSRTVRLPLPACGKRERDSVGAWHSTIPGPCASISPLAGSGSGTRSVRGIRRFPDRAPPSPRLREAGAGLGRCAASDDSRTVRLPLPASWEREWAQSVRGIRRFPNRAPPSPRKLGEGVGLSRCVASDDSRTVRLPLPACGERVGVRGGGASRMPRPVSQFTRDARPRKTTCAP